MDRISAIPWNISPMITAEPTLAAFQPLLEKNRPFITSVSKKAIKYGETDRHYLDIYYPPSQAISGDPTPILFFVYGGGFVTGARNRPPPMDLVYSCLGSFFARQGFLTIIPDYHLAPEFQYPKLTSETTPSPDLESLFIMGHSAGAVHVATSIFHPNLIPLDSDLRRRIKGIVLVSGPYHYSSKAGDGVFEAHWGSEENARENSAVSLLIRSIDWLPKERLPEILLVVAQFEPEWIMNMGLDYWRLLEWHLGKPVRLDVVKDHNHVSLNCALSSGEGEEWGMRAANWIRSVVHGNVHSAPETETLAGVEKTDTQECPGCQKREIRSFSIEIGTKSLRSQVTCSLASASS
ncbi:hypothetical protein D9756_008258 [Leucocoprinus leucothites]|uniref:Alpha/beta-hydrolase n=1 Tax=Leucocoprinus leucothites TaxID=201217 RepID=A0A8H5D1R1_9AGAR|nr:hypothetical protein D9756_008258 [Leucoagaricus leucothites]